METRGTPLGQRPLIETKLSSPEVIADRHRQLIDAARELFLDQGYHATTMRQIAKAAGWQIGTLYLYIERKEDVLCLLTENIIRRKLDALGQVPEKATARETLVAFIDAYIRLVDAYKEEVDFNYRESASMLPHHRAALQGLALQQYELLAGVVRRGIAAGEFEPVDPMLFTHEVFMIGDMWALKWWSLRSLTTVEAFIAETTELFLRRVGRTPQATDSGPSK
jgi:AcrR family transcriptional regulator